MMGAELRIGLGMLVGAFLLLGGVSFSAPLLTVGDPRGRPDRMIAIFGERPAELVGEYSTDGGKRWRAATIYVGAGVDEWRPCKYARWNKGAIDGRIPAGKQDCVWNYFFDVAMPANDVRLRLRSADGEIALERTVDLSGVREVFVIDRRNVVSLAGGKLPAPWALKPAKKKEPSADSIVCPADAPAAPALALRPNLKGWHRIYLGMEPYSALQFYLLREEIRYAVPDYLATPDKRGRDRFCQEFHVKSADMTGQDVCLALGGARYWREASVRHIRFVPMTPEEVAQYKAVRTLAETKGRPFAGYVEPVSPAYTEPKVLTLRDHIRNEMRLHKDRGCTEVYVHVIRLGIKAWYHSDVVEREAFRSKAEMIEAGRKSAAVFGPNVPSVEGCIKRIGDRYGYDLSEAAGKWTAWMDQGDPLAVGIEEGRAVGLKVFADMGMGVTHLNDSPHLTERTVQEHPEYIADNKMFLDYKKPGVRDYAVAVARELLTKYDVDGINLDFGRWGYRRSYDEPSLVEVVRRVHEVRQDAAKKWGHPITVATRIPSYLQAGNADWEQASYGGEHAWFTAALKVWARNGWIDRVMPLVSYQKMGEFSMKRYAEAVAGTNVELWGDLYWQGYDTSRSQHLNIARKWAAEGLNGGLFFYAHHRPTEFERINWMLRLIDFPGVRVEP